MHGPVDHLPASRCFATHQVLCLVGKGEQHMKPIVELNNLSVRYEEREAVRNLSLYIAPGEVLGILGPNGAGKTTTVSCIEGLTAPTSGTVRVFSADPRRERAAVYSRMGVQLQETSYPLRVRTGELCALFASFYERPADWHALLCSLDLESAIYQSVSRLSGGQRQKLSVVLALMGRPELLILDEVSTGLDPQMRDAMLGALRQIAAQGTSMVLVTHYPNELAGLAERILLLMDGEEQFLGTLDTFASWAAAKSGTANEQLSLEDAYLSVCPASSPLRLGM